MSGHFWKGLRHKIIILLFFDGGGVCGMSREVVGIQYDHSCFEIKNTSRTEARYEALVKELGLDFLQRVSLDRVASESDVVFVLTPGGSRTKNLINEDFLRRMKKTSVLVNTGRDTVVNPDALANALRTNIPTNLNSWKVTASTRS
jgi:S-adenosylhomocysteine hydrolase